MWAFNNFKINFNYIPGVHIKSGVVVEQKKRLVSTKHDNGFSDDEEDSGKVESEYGPAAFDYVSDDEDLDSDASEDGPSEAGDPWGVSLQVYVKSF